MCWNHVVCCTSTMRDWVIQGVKVGIYCDASVLNELSQLEDLHTLPGKTVRRFDNDIDVGGTDASGFFSASCIILAMKDLKKRKLRELLGDTSLFDTKSLRSLIYVNLGTKVCMCLYRCIVLHHVSAIHTSP